MEKIRIGIVGYGNLGKSAELGIRQNKDMELTGIFSRRNPQDLQLQDEAIPVYHLDQAAQMTDQIDVMILCGGSLSDLPVQGPALAGLFNTVDGFDTHAKIPEYFDAVNLKAIQANKTCIIASGWDPGMFSLNRIYAEAILPVGETYTFWGEGISQGHSDAIRRIDGVLDAKQYTIPVPEAIEAVQNGSLPKLTTREKHRRVCYVVADQGADRQRIKQTIKTMPNYFADYDTDVHFISEDDLNRDHAGLPHGGLVIRYGQTGSNNDHSHTIEYRLKLDSNPDFTANVLLAYARAAYRMNRDGQFGAKTVADVAPAYLSAKSAVEIRQQLI